MDNRLIYDVPTRVFHWLFSLLFLVSVLIAKNVDDESVIFSYHMLGGFILLLLVILRIIWGFIGSKYARFSHFRLKPSDLVKYFKSYFSIQRPRWIGHNPASSWAAILMMGLALGLSVTGYLMVSGEKETYEDIHELLANIFIVTAIAHVAGVTIESLRTKSMMGFSMIHGKKIEISKEEEIIHTYKAAGVSLFVVILGFSYYLYKSFNPKNGVLNVFNQQLQILEVED